MAVDLGNSYDPHNIVLTEKGIHQAKQTGKFLKKVYKKFDYIVSSPIKRCVQTSNYIMNKINYEPTKLIIDDRLIEDGAINDSFNGLSKEERDQIIDSDKKYQKYISKINSTHNPYKKYVLNKKIYKHVCATFNYEPNIYEVEANLRNFLDELKTIITTNSYNNILIITHGGVISKLQKIISNINIESEIFISTKPYEKPRELLGNCCCLSVGFNQTDSNYFIVEPANTYHLV